MGAALVVLSHAVGVCVIAGSLFRSVPQIVRIVRRGSAQGVSALSHWLELLGITVICAYNVAKGFPLSSFGEYGALVVQDVLVLSLIAFYGGRLRSPGFLLKLAAYFAFLFLLVGGGLPMPALVAMQTGAIAVLNASRIPQIASNWRNKGSGELSMTSVTLNTLGSVARVFTNLVLTGDPLLLGNSTLGLFLNGIIFVQCLRTQLRDKAAKDSSTSSGEWPLPEAGFGARSAGGEWGRELVDGVAAGVSVGLGTATLGSRWEGLAGFGLWRVRR